MDFLIPLVGVGNVAKGAGIPFTPIALLRPMMIGRVNRGNLAIYMVLKSYGWPYRDGHLDCAPAFTGGLARYLSGDVVRVSTLYA